MTEDNLIILFSFFINWLTLALLARVSKKSRNLLIIHLSIQLVYSILFWYCLNYESQGGTALVYWFLWIVAIAIQWLSYLVHLVVIAFGRKR